MSVYDNHIHTSNVDPARQLRAVTPADATDLTLAGRLPLRLYVGGAGDVIVVAAGDGQAVTYANVPAGSYLHVRAVRVKAATTATDIVAEY